MAKRSADPELRREISVRFRQAIDRHHLTQKKAAMILGVKRQTLWLYLNQKVTPGGDVLRRACQLWGISLTVKGFEFTADAFGSTPRETVAQAEQLGLFRALEALREAKVEAKVIGKRGDYFELSVRIRSSELIPQRI